MVRLQEYSFCEYGIIEISLLASMRISSSLLRPAIFLLLGASAVLGCNNANALTFDWSFINNSGVPSSAGSTTGTITGLQEGTNDFSIAGITATVLTSQNLPVPTVFNSGSAGNFSSGGTIVVSGGVVSIYAISIERAMGPGDKLYALRLNSGFSTYDDGRGVADVSLGSSTVTFTSVAEVPAPLPILGLPAVLFYSRKLKKRIKASRENSSNALV